MRKRSSQGRKIPERTCCVCRAKVPKTTLIRIAVAAGDVLTVDESGKGEGRGAYVCRTRACMLSPSLVRRLEHGLHVRLADVHAVAIQERLGELAPESPAE